MKFLKIISILFTFLFLLSACHTYRPVLYENNYYKSVGEEQANKDIDRAMAVADSKKIDSHFRENAKETAKDIAIGTTSGTVSGMFFGNTWVGMVCGAVWGFFDGIIIWIFGSNVPTPEYKNYVDLILEDQGYQVIGWE